MTVVSVISLTESTKLFTETVFKIDQTSHNILRIPSDICLLSRNETE